MKAVKAIFDGRLSPSLDRLRATDRKRWDVLV